MDFDKEIYRSRVCRVCLKETPELFPIFDKAYGLEGAARLSDVLTECTRYQVLSNDRLPHNICIACMETARVSFQFKRQTENAYRTLKLLLEDIKIPTETGPIDNSTQTAQTCKYCSEEFLEKNELEAHCKLQHAEQFIKDSNPINLIDKRTCPVCDRLFSRRDHMQRHLRKLHGIGLKSAKDSLEEPEVDLKTGGENADIEGKSSDVGEGAVQIANPISINDEENDGNQLKHENLLLHDAPIKDEPIDGDHATKMDNDRKLNDDKPISKMRLNSTDDNAKDEMTTKRTIDIRLKAIAPNEENRCPECQRTFSRYQHLRRHMMIHYNEKPHLCQHCSKTFSRSDHLKAHIAKAHPIPTEEKQSSNNDFVIFEVEEQENLEVEPEIIFIGLNATSTDDANIEDDDNDLNNGVDNLLANTNIKVEPGEDSDNSNGDCGGGYGDAGGNDVFSDSDDHVRIKRIKQEKRTSPKRYKESDTDSEDVDVKKLIPKSENGAATSAARPNQAIRRRRRRGEVPKTENNHCPTCLRTFSRHCHLLRHMLTHLDNKPHTCPHCPKSFARSDHLKKHVANLHEVKKFKCEQCPIAFAYPKELVRHVELRHSGIDNKLYDCEFCGKKFASKNYLSKHRLFHTDRVFACKHCEETFKERKQLRDHEKVHNLHRKFLCSICGESFERHNYLVIHMRRHNGEKPYKCQYCGKGFPRATDVKMHERYHTGTKPNLCTLCGKGFHRAYNLTIHMRTHTGERPYKCDQCDKSFTQSNDLKAHIRRHTGERFHCSKCDAAFLQLYCLRQHSLNAHGIVMEASSGRLQKFPPAQPTATATTGSLNSSTNNTIASSVASVSATSSTANIPDIINSSAEQELPSPSSVVQASHIPDIQREQQQQHEQLQQQQQQQQHQHHHQLLQQQQHMHDLSLMHNVNTPLANTDLVAKAMQTMIATFQHLG